MPAKQFSHIQEISCTFNRLVDAYSRDGPFLLESLKQYLNLWNHSNAFVRPFLNAFIRVIVMYHYTLNIYIQCCSGWWIHTSPCGTLHYCFPRKVNTGWILFSACELGHVVCHDLNHIYIISQYLPQLFYMGFHRSDYLLHSGDVNHGGSDESERYLQVELNTIASAFAGLSTQTTAMHRYLCEATLHN